MFYTTLDSYGTSGASGFLDEAELPESIDSSYSRHIAGGKFNGKEAINEQDAISIVNDSKN